MRSPSPKPIAPSTTQQVWDILLPCLEAAQGPETAKKLAQWCALPVAKAEQVLLMAVGLRLVEASNGKYWLKSAKPWRK